jgi:hypothetical protein
MPVLVVPGGGVGVVALGPARWVWGCRPGRWERRAMIQVGHELVGGSSGRGGRGVGCVCGDVAGVRRTTRTDDCGRSMKMRHFTNTKIFYGEKTVLFVGSCDFATTQRDSKGRVVQYY